ncbi:hypothetical protein [Mycolicibacterium sphagni]|nr:hypothetical protein [Mycolicibacterium sphagni]
MPHWLIDVLRIVLTTGAIVFAFLEVCRIDPKPGPSINRDNT